MPTPPSASTRRHFLRQTVLATLAAPAFLRARGANEKLNIAYIGCGGRGRANLKETAGENVVALCDVNGKNLDEAAANHPGARKYRDFRKLFDDAKDIDAVVVSTCEHTHAFATMPALKLGKHVYCEKPLSLSVWEARQVAEAAKAAKVVTQMGTQMHATANFRRTVELVQSGAIGPVRECHVWVSRAWGWQSEEAATRNKDIVSVRDRPPGASPIPPDLDWDLWLGPAPERPFNEVYFPGPKWYRWWDFGSGTMSDLGSHWNDMPFWALNLRHPVTIEASGPPPHAEIAPASMTVKYEYGPRGDMPPVTLSWHQGEDKPAIWKESRIPQKKDGVLFIGAKGMLLSDYSTHTLLPEADFKDFVPPVPFIADSPGHHAEWIAACKTGSPTLCHFDYSGALTEANHLGSIAYRLGKKLEWDPVKLAVKNAPEAARMIRREYRKGWTLPV